MLAGGNPVISPTIDCTSSKMSCLRLSLLI
jgi:hypothetical protein